MSVQQLTLGFATKPITSSNEVKAEDVKSIVETNIQKGKRAQELREKIQNKMISKDEIIEIFTEFLNEFTGMGLKLYCLYQGIYKGVIDDLCEHYPEYHLKEYISEIELKSMSMMFDNVMRNMEDRKEGSRGVVNVMRGIGMLKQFREEGKIEDEKNIYILQKYIQSPTPQMENVTQTNQVVNEGGDL